MRPRRPGLHCLFTLCLLVLAQIATAQIPTAWVMGSNSIGQLGTGAAIPVNPAAPVAIDIDVAAVSVGGQHTLYLKTDGSLWAVGANSDGQLGTGDTLDNAEPVQIATGVAAIAAGRAHSLFVKTDGTLWAMGDNAFGQLGTGDTLDRSSPAQMSTTVATVAAGDDHTLFIKTDASLWATGRNTDGQLGDTTTTDRAAPVQVATSVTRIAAGAAHTLFVKTNGSLWACGQGTFGQLGTGNFNQPPLLAPVQIVATGVAAIAAGAYHSLYVKTDGTAWGTGDNFFGQFGTGSTSRAYSPVQIATGVGSVAAGTLHSLFLKTDGSVRGAGDNRLRQLGGATTSPVLASVQLATGASAIAARQYNSAWLAADGTLWGLGDNSAGQLASTPTSQPAPATLGSGIAAISSGVAHSLHLKTDGTLWAVGDNTYGQLGLGDTLPRTEPVQIATSIASASAGSFHTLYLKTDGTLWATGRNDRGQLGTGNTTQRTTAAQITTGVSAISAGGSHSLFTKTDGTLWGMGDNTNRQLGLGGSSFSPNSTPMAIAPGVTSCAAGSAHTLYVAGGTLYATGNNSWGQLGTGTTFPTPPTSQLLVIATGVAAVSSAYQHTLFLKTDGTLWGMGRNATGQLGLSDTTPRLSPVHIASDVAAFAAGGFSVGNGHSLFAKRDGSLWAMGDNRFGQLGDGTRLDRLAPVQVPGVAHVIAVSAGDLTGAFIQAAPVAPTIATQTASQEIEYGRYAHLQVSATGGFLSYQWFRGASGDTSQPVASATSAHLLTLPIVATQSFWVRVTNELGSLDSATAAITPRARPDAMLSGSGSRTQGAFGNSLAPYRVAVPIPLASDIASLAHGSNHTLILKKNGTLWALGHNGSGQLGLGDTTYRTTPTLVATSVAACAVSSSHSLFLKTDGTLWGMGSNTYGQLGDGTTTNRSTPVQIASAVLAFAAGGSHTLFIKTDGTLWAAGLNGSGQLGLGDITERATPVQIATGVAAIAAGSSHSLFLKTDGGAWGMGANASGQLGDGTTAKRFTPVLVTTGIAAISAHGVGNHSLLLKTDGTLLGMGENDSGRLALGDTVDRSTPTRIDSGVIACSAGADHSLWIKSDHSLWGTGENAFGQLGLGHAIDQHLPQEIASGVTEARATASSSWFVTTDDTRRCMGRNHAGQFGVVPDTYFTTPVALAGSVASLQAAPAYSRFLALDGHVWNSAGPLSDGDPAPGTVANDVVRLLPTPPIFLNAGGSAEISIDPERVLFLRADGTLWGAGDNTSGQLGTGDTTSRVEPVQIASDVADAASALSATILLKADGSLWKTGLHSAGWGGFSSVRDLTPALIDRNVTAISVGTHHVLYTKGDGRLWGVGDGGYGQMGIFTSPGGTNFISETPWLITTNVARFTTGQRHTLLVKTDGTLWACGNPSFGQLGVNSSAFALGLTQVATGVADVVTTAETSFILKTDGTVWSTGNNTHGQLGFPASARRTAFTQLRTISPNLPFTGVAKIIPALSGEATFFLKTDGSLWGTGRNDLGQLGLGHTNGVGSPTLIRAQAHAVSASGLHTLFLHDPVAVAAPAIVAHPAPQTAAFGDFATLSVTASGTELLRYQWYQGASGDTSRPVAGATDTTLRLPAFAGTVSYWARVTNLAGSADSAAATITVSGAGSPTFRAWAEAAGLRGSRLSLSADADGDGLANLLEYAFRTAPDQAGAHASPTPEHIRTPEGDFLVLTHRRRKDAPPAFAYETSASLMHWDTIPLTPVVLDPDADGDGLVEEVSVALPLDPAEPRSFLRVRVSEP